MPYYHLPHTDGRTIWLRHSRRLEPVRDRQRARKSETPEPVTVETPVETPLDLPDAFDAPDTPEAEDA